MITHFNEMWQLISIPVLIMIWIILWNSFDDID